MILPRHFVALSLVAFLWPAGHAAAEVVTYVVDPNQSSLTISGTYSGIALQPRAGVPNSLTTSYSGTIVADLADTLVITGGTIIAQPNGSTSPFTGLAADYSFGASNDGSMFTGAIVDFVLTPTSTILAPLSAFDVSQVQLAIYSGSLDYSSRGAGGRGAGGGGGSGSNVLMDGLTLGAGVGTAVQSGSTDLLSIPIDAEYSLDSLDLHFHGLLVASTALPEPSTLSIGVALAVIALVPRRT